MKQTCRWVMWGMYGWLQVTAASAAVDHEAMAREEARLSALFERLERQCRQGPNAVGTAPRPGYCAALGIE